MYPSKYRWIVMEHTQESQLNNLETSAVLGELAQPFRQARRLLKTYRGRERFMGHQPDDYDAREQRFLGDKEFVGPTDERISAE